MSNINTQSKNNKPKEIEPKRGFVLIPEIFAEDSKLNLELRFIMGVLYSLSAEKGYCYASNQWMCKKFGLDERAFQRKLLKLENLGYIKRYIKKENSKGEWISRRKIYINYNQLHVKNDTQEEVCTSNLTPTARQKCHPLHVKSVGYNITENKTVNNTDIYIHDKNKIELSEEDKEIDSFFRLDDKVKQDNRYMNAGLRPLNKFPDIWLTIESFKYVLECIEKANVDKGGVFYRVKTKLDNWKAQGRSLDCVDCASWLTGWALDAQIEHEAKNLKLNFYRENRK